MCETKNDLPERTRNKVAKLLNERLADAIGLGTLTAAARVAGLDKYPQDIVEGVQHLQAKR
jgi:hypothetical protein